MKNNKILIVGLGLIGGSYAMALSKKGYEVYAIDKSVESIEYAKEKGIIKDGFTQVLESFVKDFDFVIFSLYPKTFLSWIKEYKYTLKEGIIITDTTGIKTPIVYKIYNEIKDLKIDFVPHHPMAGRELSGVKNSTTDMFSDANFIITPLKTNRPSNIKEVESLGRELEFKNITMLSPEKHDEMIAFLSQLTHVIAITLMTSRDSKNLKEYSGDSFKNITRIASINDEMWSELLLLNKDKLLSQMEMFINEFKEIEELIKNEDTNKLKEKMRLSTLRRSYFSKD